MLSISGLILTYLAAKFSTPTKHIKFAERSSTTAKKYRRIFRYRKIQIFIDISSAKHYFKI